ncbi:MAG: ribonuclease HII [Alphaproteobacteria bacterium]|nr:ribonuclease HII [Alphaproteobacteria bacterium]MCD8526010.1 ribonuclease HII [Alphaproteobacteria bacterium]
MPDFTLEDEYAPDDVCGLDEVGRGPLAGPVVAACVYIPPALREHPLTGEINDSKKLSEKKRHVLDKFIRTECIWALAECTPGEIDDLNILQASLTAMVRAYESMAHKAPVALVDGNRLPRALPCRGIPVVKGDSRSVSIAAASIIAKTYRDKLMRSLAEDHPHYGWESNAGYPTKVHMEGIAQYGITIHHRRSFAPVAAYLEAAERLKIRA